MKSLITILLGLFISWHFMDISSLSKTESVLMPVLFILFLTGFLLKVVFFMHSRGIGNPDNSGINDSLGVDISDD